MSEVYMYILSQIFVVIADILFVCSMLSKRKINIVLFLCVSDILFATHYLLLGNGLTGSAVILLDAVFLLVLCTLERRNKTKFTLPATIITMFITVVLSLLTWQGALSLFPTFSMLIYLAGMIFTNTVFVKAGVLVRNILNIIYLFILSSYVGAVLEIMLMISAIVGIVLSLRATKKSNNA